MESCNRRRDAIKHKIAFVATSIAAVEVITTQLPTFEEYLSDVENTFKDYNGIKESINAQIDRLESNQEKTEDEILKLFEDQEAQFKEIENSFVHLRSLIKSKVTLLKGAINTNESLNHCGVKVQLPQMKLPSFSGKYEEYESFREKFSVLVNESTEISPIQKFQFLLDCLSDNVRKSFDHLEFSEANFPVVLEMLRERYSNRKLSIDRHLAGLVGLKSMTKESSAELQEILDETTAHVSALKSLNVEVDTWDVMIVYLVSIKLDSETRKRWEETVNKDELSKWSVMNAFLQKRCNSLESVELSFEYRGKMSLHTSS